MVCADASTFLTLDVFTKRGQPLVIKKRGNYAYMLDESTT